MLKFLMSIFKVDPKKKILKERDKLYKLSVQLQRSGNIQNYGEVMKQIEDLEKEYDRLNNGKQRVNDTDCDAIDYDGMGNQGRFPTHK